MELEQTRPDRAGAKAPLTLKRLNVLSIVERVLVWEDGAYGLIKWKMGLELGRDSNCDFTNPDFVAYAKSLDVKGFRVSAAAELLPTLSRALADDSVSLVVCPVDYSENLALTKMLGEITDPF